MNNTNNMSIEFKLKTQQGHILKKMISNPTRWFLASEFCGGSVDCPFIGYKAPTRIAEMQKLGIITSQWSSRKTITGDKLKEYKFNSDFFTFKFLQGIVRLDVKAGQRDQQKLF